MKLALISDQPFAFFGGGDTQITVLTYDSNGNITQENLRSTYTWDPNWGNVLSIDSVGLTYDAFGHMVEQARSTTTTQILYGPTGKLALLHGQTVSRIFAPLAGEDTTDDGGHHFHHGDWLGSSRFASTTTQTEYADTAYAPFGEDYTTSSNADLNFTGQVQDTVPTYGGLYDFTYREYFPTQSRWISPDPAGLAAVDPANPQTWNRYAYVANNPLSATDPSGLKKLPLSDLINPAWYISAMEAFSGNWAMEMVGAMIESGGAVQCLNNDCSGYGTTWKVSETGTNYMVNVDSSTGSAPDDGICPTDVADCDVSAGAITKAAGWVDLGPVPTSLWQSVGNVINFLKSVPWTLTIIASTPEEPIGPAFTMAYNPSTRYLCGGGGLGASVGRNFSAGPLVVGDLQNQNAILSGASISVGAQSTPLFGAQAVGNFNGVLGEPTVGIPGGSATATYSWCGTLP